MVASDEHVEIGFPMFRCPDAVIDHEVFRHRGGRWLIFPDQGEPILSAGKICCTEVRFFAGKGEGARLGRADGGEGAGDIFLVHFL